ncbi:MAG TPA: efflux RND transporter periplasmic adaptor subunit, partial [Polyangiaceae bacterium]
AQEHVKRQDALLAEKLTTGRDVEVAHGEKLQSEAEIAAASARLKLLGVPLPQSGATIAPNGSLALTSPIDGVVVAREAVLGSYLEPNDTAFVVADPSTLWVTVQVFEADIPYFHIGTEVSLTVDAIPGSMFKGKIALLEPEVGKTTRALRGRVEVPNKDGTLRPGLFVRASVPLPESAQTGRLLVPASAVQPLGDRDVVFVERAPGKFEVRTVELERRTALVAEISTGLSVGEPIVIAGAFVLRGEATKQ